MSTLTSLPLTHTHTHMHTHRHTWSVGTHANTRADMWVSVHIHTRTRTYITHTHTHTHTHKCISVYTRTPHTFCQIADVYTPPRAQTRKHSLTHAPETGTNTRTHLHTYTRAPETSTARLHKGCLTTDHGLPLLSYIPARPPEKAILLHIHGPINYSSACFNTQMAPTDTNGKQKCGVAGCETNQFLFTVGYTGCPVSSSSKDGVGGFLFLFFQKSLEINKINKKNSLIREVKSTT